MSRYFFDIANSGYDPDDKGAEFATDEEARVEAVLFAGEYLQNNPDLLWDGRHFLLTLANESGRVLLKIEMTASEPAAQQRLYQISAS